MYKLLAMIFLALIVIIGLSRDFEMAISHEYAYVKADFPRFANKAWFGFDVGKKGGLEGMYNDFKEKMKQ
ncbi:hypothetical protein [Endozoicomonas numazuensis]|uniref:Uncharacterized protein n=1 Tax=Endozoicomonas numazuensis TaxID=1137799 RepID=A0A081NLD4_9GAMM|nr:hypothetical protein [Endozoicomonas numazuensis]KEQ19257.1 hypothetical protein GZ78_04525 [Endozoicomonas numazuensis]